MPFGMKLINSVVVTAGAHGEAAQKLMNNVLANGGGPTCCGGGRQVGKGGGGAPPPPAGGGAPPPQPATSPVSKTASSGSISHSFPATARRATPSFVSRM